MVFGGGLAIAANTTVRQKKLSLLQCNKGPETTNEACHSVT